jgi:IS1 family transposase
MNTLSRDQQVAIIAALTEGCSIRSVERLTGVHRDTIMRLSVRVGLGAARLHDRTMHSLRVNRIEMDEVWSYVGKKRRQVTKADGPDIGDQYVFTAMAATAKAIISYRVGKRDGANTRAFIADLRERVLGRPELSSDAWPAYPEAIEEAFGAACTYGQVVKTYSVTHLAVNEASRRYSPAEVVAVDRQAVVGMPLHISTSYAERANLSIRMASRRFTRLTNAFSKKLENHAAAVALYVAHYNLCRVHEALRITPAMAVGVADHIWTIGELVDACLANAPIDRRRRRNFRVIEGGLS